MLTFAQPLFLLALAGLVLPVLIHRISRARPIAWAFPSISRIRQTPLPRHGSRSLTDLLLLLLRILLLACLITALASPAWHKSKSNPLLSSEDRSTTIIVLDYSSSISGWGAMDQITDILKQMRTESSGQVGWVTFSDSVIAEKTPQKASDAFDSLSNFIRENEPEMTAGNPEVALLTAQKLAGEAGNRKLVLISDFQTSDWNDTLPFIPDQIDLELRRVGTKDRDRNVSLHQVRTLPGENGRIRILADIMNFGAEEMPVSLQATIDGNRISQELTIKAGGRTPAVFEMEKPPYAEAAWLEIPADDLYARDNRIRFTPSAPPPFNVITLNPEGKLIQGNEEIFFIDQALQIASAKEWIQFSVLPTSPEAINADTLSRIAAVIIPAESASSRSINWPELKAFADLGGLVLVTLGDDAVRALGEMKSGGFAVGNYLGLAGRDQFSRHFAGPVPDNSPLSRVFNGPSARDLYLMTIRQYSRIAPDPEAITLLQSESGDPLLMEIPEGKGHLVISTFPWDRSGSDFPLRPSFLPVVREVMGMALDAKRPLDAVNTLQEIPRSESITTVVPEDSIITKLRGGRVSGRTNLAQTDRSLAESAGLQLAPWLLIAALILWIVESFLASRLSQQSETVRGTG